jgi:hypothetical protein
MRHRRDVRFQTFRKDKIRASQKTMFGFRENITRVVAGERYRDVSTIKSALHST